MYMLARVELIKSDNENTVANIDNPQNSVNKHAISKKKKKEDMYVYVFFKKLYDRDIHAQIDRLSKSRQ